LVLGILSDTHGHEDTAERAVALLRRLGAAALVHCGDVGSTGVLDALSGQEAAGSERAEPERAGEQGASERGAADATPLPAWFVWGNTDQVAELEPYARATGHRVPVGVPIRIELGGRRIAVFHGHEAAFSRLCDRVRDGDAERFAREAACDYLLYGHSHVAADERIGGVRLINPGALHRARPRTVATLDLAHDVVEHWIVDDEDAGGRFPQRFRLEG
jgi:predicted phosphodiesterase